VRRDDGRAQRPVGRPLARRTAWIGGEWRTGRKRPQNARLGRRPRRRVAPEPRHSRPQQGRSPQRGGGPRRQDADEGRGGGQTAGAQERDHDIETRRDAGQGGQRLGFSAPPRSSGASIGATRAGAQRREARGVTMRAHEDGSGLRARQSHKRR